MAIITLTSTCGPALSRPYQYLRFSVTEKQGKRTASRRDEDLGLSPDVQPAPLATPVRVR